MFRTLEKVPLTLLALVLVLTAIVYWPTLDYGLLDWDDTIHIIHNPTFGDYGVAWTQAQVHIYMPVTWSLWALGWDLGGGNPSWLHALNVGGHLIGVVLAFLVLRRLLEITDREPDVLTVSFAVFGAAIFALHPIQVEPVAWVTSLKDIASADLGLLALLVHWTALERRSKLLHFVAIIIFALATLAKPTIVMLAPILFFIHIARGEGLKSRQLWLSTGAMALVAIPTLWLTANAHYAAQAPSTVDLFDRVLVALDTWGFAIQSFVWPGTRLGMVGRSPEVMLEGRLWINTLPFVVVATFASFFFRRKWPELGWGLLFMIILMLPVSGLLAFGAQVNTTFADRYLHLALLGPAWSLSAGALHLLRSNSGDFKLTGGLVSMAALAMIFAFTLLTVRQIPAWKDDISLWAHTVKHDPTSSFGLTQMARLKIGEKEYGSSETFARRGLEQAPESSELHHILGIALVLQTREEQALTHFRRAVELSPRRRKAWISLIATTQKLNRPNFLLETVASIDIDPRRIRELVIGMAEAFLKLGKHADVIALMTGWLKTVKGQLDADAYAIIGISFGSLGRPVDAVNHFERSLVLVPNHPVASRNIATARAAAIAAKGRK